MKKNIYAEENLQKFVEALQGVVKDNQEKKTYNVDGLVQKLIIAFCDETTASWQYFSALHIARGEGRTDATQEYQEHLDEELQHLQKIATRIQELGGKIVFDLNEISLIGHNWQRINTTDVAKQLEILKKAQKDARIFYQQIVYYANAIQDYVTADLFKDILADQTKHEFDLKRLIEEID